MLKFAESRIRGVHVGTPVRHADTRGEFAEWFRCDQLPFDMNVAQANVAQSVSGAVRGMHYSVGPGQSKYVMCVSGTVYDVLVDVREGSPTFGVVESFFLAPILRQVLAIPSGVAHGYCTLETSTVIYLCSTTYTPENDVELSPMDDALGITWPFLTTIMSTKDANAPVLEELRANGKLPAYAL